MKPRSGIQQLIILALLLAFGLGQGTVTWAGSPAGPERSLTRSYLGSIAEAEQPAGVILGPHVSQPVAPTVFDGDLRDLPQLEADPNVPLREAPRPGISFEKCPAALPGTVDPVAQTGQGEGQMPSPMMNFKGVTKFEAGGWIPPDTNGDVGPNHYIQTVNVGIGIFDKATGTPLVKISFNDLFDGTGTYCDVANNGDPIALYDPMADRWIVSDFAFPPGSSLECIAISQTGDPVSGGWYFYALEASNFQGSWHDYPKLAVWPDAYYMSANMFQPGYGSKVWALDRDAMLGGEPLTAVSFDLGPSHWSLLPSNLRGPLPPEGAPNYFATIEFPDVFQLWEFHVDWDNPGNSTFTGPTELTAADFGLIFDIPQPAPGELVDSLGDRPMMQLQYRNFGSHESLWVNHTVASGGVAGVRWYEVRDPGGAPYIFQQGTFQPDENYRWMGSLAVDQDGNVAVGYSVASETLMPGIRYAGRLFGEVPGDLPQAETSLIEGTGVQYSGGGRWGDYSAMTVDPVDDCTFWYTQEYYETNGNNWQTRIGSFRFPSCGQPKGWITGTVYNASTLITIPGAPVMAEGTDVTLTVETDASGQFSMTLPADIYTLTAGPLLPGYPDATTITDVTVSAGSTTTEDIPLSPVPYLVEDAVWIDDYVVYGNNNGYPEPGEEGLLLWESLRNTGAITATQVTAHLAALSPGVTVTVAVASYPDIAAGEVLTQFTPFEFSIAPSVTCGAQLDFQKVVTADQGVYTTTFSLDARVPLPVVTLFADDMESGSGNWTTGGANNHWAVTEEQAHSPTYAWSDSPGGNYPDSCSSWIQAPSFDLSGKTDVSLTFWHRYATENGWDFGYPEYSLDGGGNWLALNGYTGSLESWGQEAFTLPAFDNQPDFTFRFRFQSDSNTNDDGWYIDDVELTYEPFACYPPVIATGIPTLLSPPDGTVTTTPELTLSWEAGPGGNPAGYDLELDGTVFTTSEPFYTTLLDAGEHSWRVRAFNSLGYSDYTPTWTLTVLQRLHLPLILRSH